MPFHRVALTEAQGLLVLDCLRHRWRNGATHVVFEPRGFVTKLAALVPPPMFNLVRSHGALSPVARLRSSIVPLASEALDPVPKFSVDLVKRLRDQVSKALMPQHRILFRDLTYYFINFIVPAPLRSLPLRGYTKKRRPLHEPETTAAPSSAEQVTSRFVCP